MYNIVNKRHDLGMNRNIDNAYYPKEGFVLTHFMTVADPKRSAEFYLRIFGGETVRSGEAVKVLQNK